MHPFELLLCLIIFVYPL